MPCFYKCVQLTSPALRAARVRRDNRLLTGHFPWSSCLRPRFFVRAGVIATTLFGVGWGAVWAAERAAPFLVARGAAVEPPAQQVRPIFRRGDVRPTLKNPSADAREFFFTRAIYSGGRGYRRGSWAVDYPKADRQFLTIIDRLIDLLDAYERENAVRLDDPEIRRFPFLYALEVGYMYMTEAAVGVEVLLGFDLGGELRAEFDFGFVGNQDVAQLAADGGAAGREGAGGDEQDEESALEHGRWVPCDGYRLNPKQLAPATFYFLRQTRSLFFAARG